MPHLVSMRQSFDHAAEHSYGCRPPSTWNNLEQVQAIMEAAAGPTPGDHAGLAGRANTRAKPSCATSSMPRSRPYPHIPVVMHQDHGQSPAICMGAIRSASSVMMDGSLLKTARRPPPYEYNVACHPRGGRHRTRSASASRPSFIASARSRPVRGEEDGVGAEGTIDRDARCSPTRPGRRLRQADRLRCAGHRHRHQPRRHKFIRKPTGDIPPSSASRPSMPASPTPIW